jgi:hypothetical protein
MDDEQEPMGLEDMIIVDSLDVHPIPEDIPAAAKEPVETEDQDQERLWKDWAKTKDSKRDKTLLTNKQQSSKTKTINEIRKKTMKNRSQKWPCSLKPLITMTVPSIGDRSLRRRIRWKQFSIS